MGIVRFDKAFTHYVREADGKITASFTDGTSANGDVLVGADGTGSKVRAQYLPQAKLIDTGWWAPRRECRSIKPQAVTCQSN
jgi:2-polyprenyl-6-methoxyphenol hydroxylase-like FAD-dependent oxidoreductase